MDDVKIASKRKNTKSVKTGRRFWQYIFDIIIKTLLCAAVISIDFTLFANSGSYNIFSTGTYGNLEALYIYGGIAAVSFLLMFIASFIRPLENIVLSAIFALFAVAIVNQFATFEKKSGLLLLFDGIFSDDLNIILYEHFHLIMLSLTFIVSWIFLSLLSRSFLFYVTLGVCAFLGWLISESYLNPNVKYFNEVAGLPNFKKENMGKNIIFLSFNDLTSINNLKSLNNDKQGNEELAKAYKNALGFYNANDFTLYPNALIDYQDNAFKNLISSYNSQNTNESAEENILSTVQKDTYFDFKSLQTDRIYIKNNKLYDYLRKNDYKINVFQTRDIDTCYVNNTLVASSCKEKINNPISFNNEKFTTFDKLVVLASQWLETTGLVPSTNFILYYLQYAGSVIPSEFAPKNLNLSKLYSYNSVNIFDQLIDTIDKLSGNQAYFAVIDLPSDNYIYDEFCEIKYVDQWMGAKNSSYSNTPITKRKQAYAEQLNCLYGSLQKFVKQLDTMGELENTTIIIQGLNNPLDLIGNKMEYYEQIQGKRNVTFAVRQSYAKQSDINYSVCSVKEFINSELFDVPECVDYQVLNTTAKNIEAAKKVIDSNKFKEEEINNAVKSFNNWFTIWSSHNGYSTSNTPEIINNVIEEAPLMDEVIEDIPERKMESISLASDESEVNENVEDIKEEVEKTVEEVKNPSKIEELAKKTFDEISAKVDNLKNNELKLQKNENLIEKINNVTNDISLSIDETIKNVTDKVVEAFDKTKSESATEKKEIKAVEKEIDKRYDEVAQSNEYAVDNIEDVIEEQEEVAEDIVAKTKRAIKEKEKLIIRQQTVEANQEVKAKVTQQSEALREVLEAPVADGQDLSPEELKRIYRNKIKNAVKNTNVQVEVIER